jgi:hypothetical protein
LVGWLVVWLVGWLVGCFILGGHLLLSDFRPYAIICVNVCVVITVATLMMLRDFVHYETMLMTMYVFTTLDFPRHF